MFQLVCQAAVQTERLQLKPDEPKPIVIKKDKQARGALRTREAMTRYQTCSIETETHSEVNASLSPPYVLVICQMREILAGIVFYQVTKLRLP